MQSLKNVTIIVAERNTKDSAMDRLPIFHASFVVKQREMHTLSHTDRLIKDGRVARRTEREREKGGDLSTHTHTHTHTQPHTHTHTHTHTTGWNRPAR